LFSFLLQLFGPYFGEEGKRKLYGLILYQHHIEMLLETSVKLYYEQYRGSGSAWTQDDFGRLDPDLRGQNDPKK
jgi:hypothetical protein